MYRLQYKDPGKEWVDQWTGTNYVLACANYLGYKEYCARELPNREVRLVEPEVSW